MRWLTIRQIMSPSPVVAILLQDCPLTRTMMSLATIAPHGAPPTAVVAQALSRYQDTTPRVTRKTVPKNFFIPSFCTLILQQLSKRTPSYHSFP